MSFISFRFAVFLPIVFFLYYSFPKQYRWTVLLVSSYVFYSFAGIRYLAILIYVTAISYLCTRYFEKTEKKKRILIFGIILMILPLLLFKYLGFLVININLFLHAIRSPYGLSVMEIMLPAGISFYTFSALAYVIDVAQKKYEPFRNPLHLASGLSFFPCLVSGPIERQNKLVPQIVNGNVFDYSMATYGLKQIAWGLFEKMVIADNFAVFVDKVFSDVRSYSGAPLLIGSLFFSIQIYCDFAGYSEIASGIAKLFGINLTRNFMIPYFSTSFQEFWKKWHISLSSWFRDYVYIPLGGNKKGNIRKNINVIITMIISGLWHGAAWTFIIWGLFHGIVQVIENISGLGRYKTKNRMVKLIKMLIVFSLCNVLWVFFRASSFSDAWYLICHAFDGIPDIYSYVIGLSVLGIERNVLLLCFFEFSILFLYDYYSQKTDVIKFISSQKLVLRWLIYCIFIILIALLSYKGTAINFVYAGF